MDDSTVSMKGGLGRIFRNTLPLSIDMGTGP